MSGNDSRATLSGFDAVTCIVSAASLLGSAFSATLLVPAALSRDLYGGTAFIVFIVIFFQLIGFGAAVGVPSLVLLLRRRLKLSRAAVWMLTIGLTGVAAEVLALAWIPRGSGG
jgi:hypothetical protein